MFEPLLLNTSVFLFLLLAFNLWMFPLLHASDSPFAIVLSVVGSFAVRVLSGKEILKELFHVETVISRTCRARHSFQRGCCR